MPISYVTYNEGIDSDIYSHLNLPTSSDNDLEVGSYVEEVSIESKSISSNPLKFREIRVMEGNQDKYIDVMKLTTDHKIITINGVKEPISINSIDSTLSLSKKIFLNLHDQDQVEIIQKSYKLKITTPTNVINVIGNQYEILTENGFVNIEDLKKNSDESTLDFLKDENGALIKIKVLKNLEDYYLKSFGISDVSEKDYFHTEKISADDYPYMKFKQKKINFDVKKVSNVQTTLLKFNIGEATDSFSAKLRLYNTKKSGQNVSGKINVYKQLSDWQVVETGNPFPKFSKPTLLNVMKGELIGTIDFDSTSSWIEFTNDNLKNVVNSWIANPDSNHGIYLEGKFEESKLSTYGYMVAASFASFESSLLASGPQLILEEDLPLSPLINFDHNGTESPFHIAEIEMYDSNDIQISSSLFTALGYYYKDDGTEILHPNNGEDGFDSSGTNPAFYSKILDGNVDTYCHTYETGHASIPSGYSHSKQRVKIRGDGRLTGEITKIRIYNRYGSTSIQDRLIGKTLTFKRGDVNQFINGDETYVFTGNESGFYQSDEKNIYMEFTISNQRPEFKISSRYNLINGNYYKYIDSTDSYDIVYNNPVKGLFMFYNTYWDLWLIFNEYNETVRTTGVIVYAFQNSYGRNNPFNGTTWCYGGANTISAADGVKISDFTFTF